MNKKTTERKWNRGDVWKAPTGVLFLVAQVDEADGHSWAALLPLKPFYGLKLYSQRFVPDDWKRKKL